MVMPVYSSSPFHVNATDIRMQMETLERKLASGKNAESYAQLGSDRPLDMTLRARLKTNESYQETIKTVGVRIQLMDQTFERMDEIGAEMRNAARISDYDVNSNLKSPAQLMAKEYLKELISLLNTDAAGRHLFAGRDSLTPPVEDINAILLGSNGRDGYITVAQERLEADMGADELGRLVMDGVAGPTVSLSEDGDHIFGLKLNHVSSTNTQVSFTQPTGASPKNADITFGDAMSNNQTVTVSFDMPDGTVSHLKMTAIAGEPSSINQFEIGATADETAANFNAALEDSLMHFVKSEMAAASQFAASSQFFMTEGGALPQRVDGPPATATALRDATEDDTVFWYTGENNDTDPRASVSANIAKSSKVGYGVRANESPLAKMVGTLAALSIGDYDDTIESKGKFDGMTDRASVILSETEAMSDVRHIQMEVAISYQSTERALDRHTSEKTILQGLLDDIEAAPTEQTVMELFSLETRLQASYQTTSMLQRLSLVNYMS